MSDKDLIQELAEDEKVKRLEVHHVYDDEEEEIDLVELAKYLWGKKVRVIGAGILCLALGAAFTFGYQGNKYEQISRIRIPTYNGMLINTCIEYFKNDIENFDPEAKNRFAEVKQAKGTSILEFTFKGNDEKAVRDLASQYSAKSKNVIYTLINEQAELEYRKKVINIAKGHADAINNRLMDEHYNTQDSVSLINSMNLQIAEAEKTKVFAEPEILEMPKTVNLGKKNAKKNIGIAFIAGLVLSCGWYVAKFLFKDMKKA